MLKLSMILALSVFSFASLANVELFGKVGKVQCQIIKNEVTKTVSFGVEKELKLIEKKSVRFEGLEEVAKRAASLAQSTTAQKYEIFEMKLDGETYSLSDKDSGEALALIQLMVNTCGIKF